MTSNLAIKTLGPYYETIWITWLTVIYWRSKTTCMNDNWQPSCHWRRQEICETSATLKNIGRTSFKRCRNAPWPVAEDEEKLGCWTWAQTVERELHRSGRRMRATFMIMAWETVAMNSGESSKADVGMVEFEFSGWGKDVTFSEVAKEASIGPVDMIFCVGRWSEWALTCPGRWF